MKICFAPCSTRSSLGIRTPAPPTSASTATCSISSAPTGAIRRQASKPALPRWSRKTSRALNPLAQTAALQKIENEPWFVNLAELAAEGYYADPENGGNAGAASWAMIGYQPRLPTQADEKILMRDSYDCIVVGAGAAGSIIAYQLTKAGKTVLLLERGPKKTYASDPRRDHLRNQRYSLYGHNAGPDDGAPRVFVDPQGVEHKVLPYQPGYHANAALVGGGTVVYGGQAWRFLPKDFRMASTYGVPKGSSLVDWPIAYEDLAPYYERAEWEIGVSGDPEGNIHQGKRRTRLPDAGDAGPSRDKGAARGRGGARHQHLHAAVADEFGAARRAAPPASNAAPASASPARPTPRTACRTPCCPRRWRPGFAISSAIRWSRASTSTPRAK